MTEKVSSLSGSHCLVTGGAGFIGSHVVDMLRSQGATVRVLDNLSTGFRHNLDHFEGDSGVELVEGDVCESDVTRAAMKDVDYVFHLAAMVSVPRSLSEPQLCHAWCATSTVNLLQAAADEKIRRFVLASTSAAYGDSPFVSKREVDAAAPLSTYAAAKLSAEAYCKSFYQAFGLETVALRYFNVFGPRQDPQSEYSAVIPRFVSMILSGERPIIYGDGNQSRDFVFVTDVANANRLAATAPGVSGSTFNVGRGERTTLLELLTTLSEILGREIEPIHEPPRPGDIRDSLADITEARQRLGFEPLVTVGEGLRQSVDYYRRLVQPVSA